MLTKKLKSGLELPALGFGTWLMGGDIQRRSDHDDQDIASIQCAIDVGYLHIDTAESYGDGHAEEIVGAAIKPYKREDLFIASKASHGHHDEASLPRAIEGSLKRLNTDYIDLYYLHRPTLETPFEETAAILDKFCESGKIKNIGVCNFSIRSFEQLQSYMKTKILANQVHYNLAFREAECSGLLDHAIREDYYIIAWRPLRLVKRNDPHSALQNNIWEKGCFPIIDEMAQKYNVSNVQIALSWTTYLNNVCTLIKSSNPLHIKECAHGYFKLSDEDYKKLSDAFQPQYKISDTVPLI